jgi:hypothetical protein
MIFLQTGLWAGSAGVRDGQTGLTTDRFGVQSCDTTGVQTCSVAMLLLFVRRGREGSLLFKKDDIGVQKGAYSGVFGLFGSMACRNLFCMSWVVCMLHFQFVFGGCLCLNQVDGVEDQRGAKVKTS